MSKVTVTTTVTVSLSVAEVEAAIIQAARDKVREASLSFLSDPDTTTLIPHDLPSVEVVFIAR